MSAYENVVTGKLKLKGKALDVKAGGTKKAKKKKMNKVLSNEITQTIENEFSEGNNPSQCFPTFIIQYKKYNLDS